VQSVSWAARELGVAWYTVMDAVTLWGSALVEHPDRVGATKAIGVDETSFLSATATERTRWVSSIFDVEGRVVIDLIEGRQAPDLDRWLSSRPALVASSTRPGTRPLSPNDLFPPPP
jgi:hypothetical protein